MCIDCHVTSQLQWTNNGDQCEDKWASNSATKVSFCTIIIHLSRSCKRLPPEVVLANCGSMAGQMLLSSAVCHNYMILLRKEGNSNSNSVGRPFFYGTWGGLESVLHVSWLRLSDDRLLQLLYWLSSSKACLYSNCRWKLWKSKADQQRVLSQDVPLSTIAATNTEVNHMH